MSRSGLLIVASLILASAGCSEAMPSMAPAKGKVTYKGQPLKFGTVMFQPAIGQPAHGEIQPDGSFELWTERYGEGAAAAKGAAIGMHSVRITCFEGQAPTAAQGGDLERPLGKSLIPERYNNVEASGLKAEVKPDAPAFEFNLTDGK